jgi:hypothetical protein
MSSPAGSWVRRWGYVTGRSRGDAGAGAGVAPDKAKQRREHMAKRTRVERWAEDSGNAGLARRELPPAEVLAADQRVTAWARQLRSAELEGGMDALRARAYLDIFSAPTPGPWARAPKTPANRRPRCRAGP